MTIGHGSKGYLELLQKSFLRFHFEEDWDLEVNIEKRGVEDSTCLPGYYFRDDALLIWRAMKEYVVDMINIFYESDQDVEDDFEIQGWFDEIIRYLKSFTGTYFFHNRSRLISLLQNMAMFCNKN